MQTWNNVHTICEENPGKSGKVAVPGLLDRWFWQYPPVISFVFFVLKRVFLLLNNFEEKAMNVQKQRPDDTVVLSDAERQPCEVWTRVMGYHRPVASFNIGKRGEHEERRFFRESRATG